MVNSTPQIAPGPAPTGPGRPPSPQRRPGRGRLGSYRSLVPVLAALTGLLLSTAAATARGTDLRGQRDQLPQLVAAEQRQVADSERQLGLLRADVEARTARQAVVDARVAAARSAADRLAAPAGLTPVTGSGLRVALSDAPPAARSRPLPAGVPAPAPNDLVVHQQDVQAVVNALWAGGAEAMTIMGRRVVATTAVRCVGNTLLLQGAVYSPPFVVQAVGDPVALQAALDKAPGVQVFRQYVSAYGLVYSAETNRALTLPGYAGTVELDATPVG